MVITDYNLVEEFAVYLFNAITGIDSNRFEDLGDYDTQYWIEMSRNGIKHSSMLMDYLNQEHNITV